jgi:hypothetical protein
VPVFLYLVWIWFLNDCDNTWFVISQTPHYPGCMGNGVYQFHGELLQNQIFPLFQSSNISIFCFKVETTNFRFSLYAGVFLGDIMNWWVKDFGCWNVITIFNYGILLHITYYSTDVLHATCPCKTCVKFLTCTQCIFQPYLKALIHCATCFDWHWSSSGVKKLLV